MFRKTCSTLLPILVLLLAIGSCKKSKDTGLPLEPDAAITVTTSISGRVLDENGNPVSGGTVRAGGRTASTDVNGSFLLTNASVKADAALIRVVKDGYFTAFRTIMASAGQVHQVVIRLNQRGVTGTFNAQTGGTINLGATSVQFSANSVATENGQPYTGTVNVHLYSFNPAAADFAVQMPGDLRGTNASGQQQGLQAMAMITCELTGANGERLNVASGQTAQISLPLSLPLQAAAPATLPLWFFDESTGLWKEEGAATRNGAVYTASVRHFTTWTAAIPFSTAVVAGRVMASGSPLSSGEVSFRTTSPDSFRLATTMVDANGNFRLRVPAGVPLRLSVWSSCATLLSAAAAGPYPGGTVTNLGNVAVSGVHNASVLLNGTVTGCNNNPVALGFVHLVLNGRVYRAPIANGSYTFNFSLCSAGTYNAQLYAYDQTNSQQGATSAFSLSTGTSQTQHLSTCGTTVTEFVTVTADGFAATFAPPADTLMAITRTVSNYIEFNAYTPPNSAQVLHTKWLADNVNGTGTFAVRQFSTRRMNGGVSQFLVQPDGTPFTMTVTRFEAIGGFVEGTLNGSAIDMANPQAGLKSITGSFRMRRY